MGVGGEEHIRRRGTPPHYHTKIPAFPLAATAGQYELGSLRRRLGYVSQNVQLLQGTILDNILYGDEAAGPEAASRTYSVSAAASITATFPASAQAAYTLLFTGL